MAEFDPRSIRVFDPVDFAAIGKIWREFIEFSYSMGAEWLARRNNLSKRTQTLG